MLGLRARTGLYRQVTGNAPPIVLVGGALRSDDVPGSLRRMAVFPHAVLQLGPGVELWIGEGGAWEAACIVYNLPLSPTIIEPAVTLARTEYGVVPLDDGVDDEVEIRDGTVYWWCRAASLDERGLGWLTSPRSPRNKAPRGLAATVR